MSVRKGYIAERFHSCDWFTLLLLSTAVPLATGTTFSSSSLESPTVYPLGTLIQGADVPSPAAPAPVAPAAEAVALPSLAPSPPPSLPPSYASPPPFPPCASSCNVPSGTAAAYPDGSRCVLRIEQVLSLRAPFFRRIDQLGYIASCLYVP